MCCGRTDWHSDESEVRCFGFVWFGAKCCSHMFNTHKSISLTVRGRFVHGCYATFHSRLSKHVELKRTRLVLERNLKHEKNKKNRSQRRVHDDGIHANRPCSWWIMQLVYPYSCPNWMIHSRDNAGDRCDNHIHTGIQLRASKSRGGHEHVWVSCVYQMLSKSGLGLEQNFAYARTVF